MAWDIQPEPTESMSIPEIDDQRCSTSNFIEFGQFFNKNGWKYNQLDVQRW